MTKTQNPKERIVITGGNGFVGKYLQDELRENWDGVVIDLWDLPEVDVTKPETYRRRLQKLQPDWLVHLAAVSSVPLAIKDPILARRINVEASQNILQAIKELRAQTKVLAISTADIYGSTPLTTSGSPLSELSLEQAKPQNPYAQSKWEMEKIIEENFNDHVVRVRAFPHIGPGQGLGFVTADFASQIAAIERGKQVSIIKVGSLEAKRDFTDVRDIVRAYRLLMESGKLGEVYHVASGKAVSIQEILNQLLSLSKVKIQVEQDPSHLRPHDVAGLVGDTSKLRAATGWEPTIPLKQTLQDILDWWREKTS